MKRMIPVVAIATTVLAACTAAATPAPPVATAIPAPTAVPAATVATTPEPAALTAADRAALAGPTPTPRVLQAAVAYADGHCTYTGPAVLPRASHLSLTFANDPSLTGNDRANLQVIQVQNGTSWETIVADAAATVAAPPDKPIVRDVPPSWFVDYDELTANFAGAGRPLDVLISGDLYVVQCAVYPDGVSNSGMTPIKVYPAILLKAKAA